MKKLIREAQPPCLAMGFEEWTARYTAARVDNLSAAFRWYSQSCYQRTRDALLVMTQQHCAFCDGFVGMEGRETVEHFRPKSAFPQDAFLWENLFPCCDVCQTAKLEKYDILLLKPDESSYRFEDFFICNYGTGELQAAPGISALDKLRAEKTLDLYGLNLPLRKQARKRELIKFRAVNREEMSIDEFPYRYFLEV